MHETSVWEVFLAALFTALATGLGALPFFFLKRAPAFLIGIYDAIAAGLVLGACFGLISGGAQIDLGLMVAGLVLGLVFISFLNQKLSRNANAHPQRLKGAADLKALMIIWVMTVHSFAEGIGVGVAFGGGQALGLFITLAIAIHNIPEGLAISLVLVPNGTSPFRASLWSIFSSLPQPIMAVPAFLLVTLFHPFLPFGLGLAAGAMLWIAFYELLPAALEKTSSHNVAVTATLSLATMVALQYLIK